jgi:glycolate oxidase
MELKVKEKVSAKLEKIVGAEHVSTALPDLYGYSQDMTENEPHWPDFVVMPGSVEEVQGILRLANREKIPVVPFTAGANIGGLTIPLKGGIVLDLRRMNRVIEFNEEDRYIVVEPGFTFGDLRRYLDKNYPHLWYSFPAAPPSTSVMSNALLMGCGYLMNVQGGNWDNTNGLEVVLPTGEVVKIGSCSVSPYWFSRAPLPDLAGLFFGWQGGTGVVTKIAVQLWPRHELQERKTLITSGIGPTMNFMRRIGKMRILDLVAAFPFEPSLVMAEPRTAGTFDRPPGEDMFTVTTLIMADTEDELKAKAAVRDVVIKEEFEEGKVTVVPPEMVPVEMGEIPIRGTIERLGGVTWMGTFGPTSKWAEATEKAFQLFDKYRLLRIIAYTPLRGVHFGMFRPIVGFNKGDADEVERVHKFMQEALVMTLDMGFVPYKAPYWVVEEMMRRGDPNWVELLRRVKKMLDPNNIMNPGRYGAPEE